MIGLITLVEKKQPFSVYGLNKVVSSLHQWALLSSVIPLFAHVSAGIWLFILWGLASVAIFIALFFRCRKKHNVDLDLPGNIALNHNHEDDHGGGDYELMAVS